MAKLFIDKKLIYDIRDELAVLHQVMIAGPKIEKLYKRLERQYSDVVKTYEKLNKEGGI